MKKVFVILIFSFFLCCFSCNVSASTVSDIYKSQYSAIEGEDLESYLPENVTSYFEGIDLSDIDTDWKKQLDPKNIFLEISHFFKSSGKKPIISGSLILAVLLFSSTAATLFKNEKTVGFVVTVGILSAGVMPVISTLLSCIKAIGALSGFMLFFIPIYAAILISRGKNLTAAGFSTVTLSICEGVSLVSSYIVVPLTGMQLALSIAGSVLPDVNMSSIGKAVKRASVWILSISSTVFIAILGMQTMVSNSADSVSARTAKFVIGTALPVVGTAVSEGLMAVKGCLKLLGSNVAVYAILALCLLLLPVIIELLLWRLCMMVCAVCADILSLEKPAELLRSIDSCVAFVMGVGILVGVLFSISIILVAVV